MRLIFALTLGILTVAPVVAFAQDLPPGPGADLVGRACTSCHGIEQTTSLRHDADGWRATVLDMVNNGAVLTDAEQDQVVQYLSTNFGLAPAAPGADAAAPAQTPPPADAAAPAQTPPADQAAPAQTPPPSPLK